MHWLVRHLLRIVFVSAMGLCTVLLFTFAVWWLRDIPDPFHTSVPCCDRQVGVVWAEMRGLFADH